MMECSKLLIEALDNISFYHNMENKVVISTRSFMKTDSKGSDISNEFWTDGITKYQNTMVLPEDKVYSTQDLVYPDVVKDKIKSSTTIKAVKDGDNYYIVDGHHSYTAEKLRGNNPIVKVYTLE